MNILLVEDQSNYAFMVQEMLQQEAIASVVAVERLDQAIDHLAVHTPQLILLDLALPDSHGLDTLLRLRQLSGEIPIIVLTGTHDEQLAIEAVRRGAQDYLVKGETDKRGLIHAIHYAIERGNAEHKYRELVESIDAIVWEADPATWRFTFVSKAAEKILGYPTERWLREANFWVNLIHPDDRLAAVDYCKRQVDAGDNHELEYRAIAVDGRVVWLRDMVQVLKNQSGQPINLRGVMIDITQAKEAEAERQKHYGEIQSLQAIGQKTLNDGDDSKTLDNILDLAISFGGYDAGAIRLLNAKGDIDRVIFRGYENPDSIRMLSDSHTQVQGHVRSASLSRILATREANVFEDIQSREGLEGFKREGIRSAVVVPIGTKDEVLGILQVGSRKPAKFPSNQVHLLEAVGSHIGVVIQKIRLYEESRAQFGQLQTIRQFEQALISTLDLGDVLKVLLDDIEGFFPFPVALSVHLVDPDKQTFDYVTGRNFVGGNFTAGTSIHHGLFGAVLRSPAPVEIAVLANDPRTTQRDLIRQEGFVSCLAIALKLRQEAVGVLAVRTWQEHKFTTVENSYLSAIAARAAIAIHNAWLYAEVTKKNHELSALFNVTTAASQSLDVNLILHEVARRINEIFDFDATRVLLFDDLKENLLLHASYETQEGFSASPKVFAKGQGISGHAAAAGEAIVIENIDTDARYETLTHTRTALKTGQKFAASFPIKYREETLGAIACAGRNPRHLTDHELRMITAMSSQIAIAIANARLYGQTKDQAEQLRQLASHSETVREQERIRIARELHDELGQALTDLKFDVFWVHRKLAKTHPALCARLAHMSDSLDATIDATRKLSTRLRPDILDKLGLAAAVEWQLQDFRKRTGIKFHFASHPSEIRLHEQQSTALFRILQEALTNVARHSAASRVRIALELQDSEASLRIDDDGGGIEDEKIFDARSLGLLGMRERAVALGGSITVQRNDRRGTTVIARLPMAQLNENVEIPARSIEL